MADTKKYLDWAGLSEYDAKIKAYIKGATPDALQELINLVGELPEEATSEDIVSYIAEYVNGKILSGNIADVTDATKNGLVNADQVKTYVAAEVADLEGAMHFIDVFEIPEGQSLPVAKIVDGEEVFFEAGDVIIVGNKEYVYNGAEFKEIGDETIYATKATTIAGVDLNDNITAQELKEALDIDDIETALGTEAVAAQGVEGEEGYVPAKAATGLIKDVRELQSVSFTAITNDEIDSLFEEESSDENDGI